MSDKSFYPGSKSRTTAQVRAREVEGVACPSRIDAGGLHLLTNGGGVTYCEGCGETWAAIDELVNGGLKTRGGGDG